MSESGKRNRHKLWGITYVVVLVLDIAACVTGLATSSWVTVTLTPTPGGRYCHVLSQKQGTMSSGLLSPHICDGRTDCVDVLMVIGILGFVYVFFKSIACVLAIVALSKHRLSRIQGALQALCLVLAIAVVVTWGLYASNSIGTQFIDWSCSAWSFYLFCAGSGAGFFSLIGVAISLSYHTHDEPPILPIMQPKVEPAVVAAVAPPPPAKARHVKNPPRAPPLVETPHPKQTISRHGKHATNAPASPAHPASAIRDGRGAPSL